MRPIKHNDTTNYTIEEATQLLPFLLQTLTNKSRNAVKSILTRGQVAVDGQTITQHNHPLNPGQVVSIISNQTSLKLSAFSGINILHEDDAIIVINKDIGVLSMSADGPNEVTAYQQLMDYVKKDNPNNRIYIVHRLDRDTSGVMVYAKTEEAKLTLQKNWHKMVKERTYTALVEGEVEKDEGSISSWLTENAAMKMYSSPYDNGGKFAVTHYKKIAGNKNYSLLEVELDSGRKNQIRVHMQDIGHPIARDKKYGAETNPIKRLGLHASTLAFTHPTTGKLVRYTAKVPNSFYKHVKG
ncbi:RluA family pseudouridine synthase [Alkalibacterium sp. MB6]|uniref:RluA family pseudouridine synthase n=1 Tax=Alkalibacterium sp. MB6 TaxID=2081965 RepID=UPI00137A98C4|nr:RluA family pseudouridine synthase [Alkalibacterium sp. MB6]